MTQKNEHVQEEREINFMIDPTANFVSLVDRGANQIPFRVVKNQKENEMKILHKIIVPAGTDEEAIKSCLGEDLADVVKLEDKAERGGYVSYEQVPYDAFKSDSFEMVTLDEEKNIKGVQGVTKDEGNFVTNLFKRGKKTQAIAVEADALDISVVKNQYTEEVYYELMKFNDAVAGILAQEKGEPRDKMKAVKMVVKNLVDYLDEALAVLKGEALEIDLKRETAQTPEENVPAEGEKELAEKSEEEGEKKIVETGEEAQKSETPAEEQKNDDTLTKLTGLFEQLNASVSNLNETVTGLKGDFDGFKEEVKSDVKSVKDDVDKVQKSIPTKIVSRDADDVETRKVEKKEGVFKGVLGI